MGESVASEQDDGVAICRFLQQQHVLTLCASASDDAWCANCFYVFDQSRMALYLMTERTTRHGALMLQNPWVVGTVARQTRTVALIQGVQYRGCVHPLTDEPEEQARAMYCRRFPVALALRAPVWSLALHEVKMTDNRLGFGKKLFWKRDI